MAVLAPPVVADYQETTSWVAATTPQSSPAISWHPGDLILFMGAMEGPNTINVPTATGLTFNSIALNTTASTCGTRAAIALPTASGSSAVSASNTSGANHWGFGVWVIRGGRIGRVTEQHTTTDTVAVTVQPHSFVAWIVADFGAVLGTITPTPTNTREATDDGTNYSISVADITDQPLATVSYGQSGGSASAASIIVVEVLGNQTADLDGFNPSADFGPGETFGPNPFVEDVGDTTTTVVSGTTYAKDSTFTAATVLGAPDVAEHAHTATLLAGTNLSQARVAEHSRVSNMTTATTLVGVKAVERPRSSTATAGMIFAGPDVFTASELGVFTAGSRLVAADAFTATDTATFTTTSKMVAADVFEATETATFVAGTTISAGSQAGFVAKTARFIAGTVASAAKAVTVSRVFTATAGTLLRAVSASPVVQRLTTFTAGTKAVAADATTFSRTATVTARAVVVGDDIFIATETATFRAGTVASGVSQKTVAAISAKTATFTAGTQLVALKSLETAAPIGHIDGSGSSSGVDNLTAVTSVDSGLASAGVDGASNLAGVIE